MRTRRKYNEETGGQGRGEPFLDGFLKSPKDEKGYKKAAKFLLVIGKDEASKVLKHFRPEEIERITEEIAGIQKVEAVEADKILSEFGFLKQKGKSSSGGRDTARSILVAAFGQDKGEAIFRKAVPDAFEKPFSFLNDLETEQIRILLKSEPVQVVALVIPFIDPRKASKLLTDMDAEQRRRVVFRIAKMQRIAPEAIQKTEAVLKERIRTRESCNK